MIISPRTGHFTFAEFLELVAEDQKADLIEGNIIMASPESVGHNDLLAWLDKVLGTYVDERGLGKLSVNRVAFRLTDKNAPEPDLAFVRTDRLHVRKSGYVDGPPDVAVEIVSSESVQRDYDTKRRLYETAGVQEYWILDPDESRATFLVQAQGRFAEAPTPGGVFHSNAIAGFRIQVDWLWQQPFPSPLTTVKSLLDAPP